MFNFSGCHLQFPVDYINHATFGDLPPVSSRVLAFQAFPELLKIIFLDLFKWENYTWGIYQEYFFFGGY
jgi:hypothetical protein